MFNSSLVMINFQPKPHINRQFGRICHRILTAGKQILTFFRKETGELKLMKMQPIIKEALKLIRSTIPTTIEIKQDISAACGAIKADPTALHRVQ